MKPTVEVYEERSGVPVDGLPPAWRWRLRAGNGEVLCSGEGHTRQTDALRAAMRVQEIFASDDLSFDVKAAT